MLSDQLSIRIYCYKGSKAGIANAGLGEFRFSGTLGMFGQNNDRDEFWMSMGLDPIRTRDSE